MAVLKAALEKATEEGDEDGERLSEVGGGARNHISSPRAITNRAESRQMARPGGSGRAYAERTTKSDDDTIASPSSSPSSWNGRMQRAHGRSSTLYLSSIGREGTRSNSSSNSSSRISYRAGAGTGNRNRVRNGTNSGSSDGEARRGIPGEKGKSAPSANVVRGHTIEGRESGGTNCPCAEIPTCLT